MNWYAADADGVTSDLNHVQIAILQDIRDELQILNRLLGCRNAVAIPDILRKIVMNTTKPKRKKKAAAK